MKAHIYSVMVLATLLFGGCASYKAGRPAPIVSDLWIAPVVNESFAPQIVPVVSERLRDDFLSGTGVRLSSRDDASAILEVTLTDYSRVARARGLPVATERRVVEEDTGMSQAFDLVVTARVVLTDSDTGAVLLQREVVATSQSISHPYITSAAEQERLLLPVLARDLSRRIYDMISSSWETR